MGRLLTWNDGLGLNALEVVQGPNVRNSGSNTAADGSEQTFEGIGSVWAFRLGLTIKQGRAARAQRGILDALMGGANAMRFTVIDPDMMTPAEAGMSVPDWLGWNDVPAQPWSNGMPWENGQFWKVSPPVVRVAASAGVDSSVIRLRDEFWGHALGIGDRIGFFPFHFGVYQITEVLEPGTYRVKYRLRKAIAAGDFCTLRPVIVLRPTSKTSAMPPARVPAHTETTSVTLVEVIDPYVRQYFTG
ncbi:MULTISPECIES: hypothetical protein [Chelativorans]|jgi:hypothetical protein|uniref:Uncharacterized protein n=1 Tax=Chelativorans sp. (strain BNC1) TaxID=266779 RepID=Q11IZ7_CHESB|nr:MULTISPECIES: hypothetical protein [Chelativorans]